MQTSSRGSAACCMCIPWWESTAWQGAGWSAGCAGSIRGGCIAALWHSRRFPVCGARDAVEGGGWTHTPTDRDTRHQPGRSPTEHGRQRVQRAPLSGRYRIASNLYAVRLETLLSVDPGRIAGHLPRAAGRRPSRISISRSAMSHVCPVSENGLLDRVSSHSPHTRHRRVISGSFFGNW